MQTIDIITDGPVSGFTKGLISTQLPPGCTNLMDSKPTDIWITSWQANVHHRHMVGGLENSSLVIVHPSATGGLNTDAVFRYTYKRFILGRQMSPTPTEDVEVLLLSQPELNITSDSMAVAQGLVEYYAKALEILRDRGGVDNFISLSQGSRLVTIQYHRSN